MMPQIRSVPTAFNENYGSERLDGLLGINFYVPSGNALAGNGLAFDVRLPISQYVRVYQLEVDSIVSIGWQKTL